MTDLTWIAPTVTALGSLVASIVAAVLALKSAKKSDVAATHASEAKEQAAATAKAVDGKMTEVVELVRKEATADATLVEKAAQSEREGAAATAVLKEKEKTPVVTPAVVADSLSAKGADKK